MDTKQIEIKDKCPTCGSEIESFTQKNKHCNGHWNQIFNFKCGCEVRFSPNFMDYITERQCPNDPMIKERNLRFKKEMDRLILYIGKLKIDDEHKKGLTEKVDWYARYKC